MKRQFQSQAFVILVTTGLIFGHTACTKSEKNKDETAVETAVENTGTKASKESEEAFYNFKTWINEKERDTMFVYDRSRDWNEEIADREDAYNERVAAVDKYNSEYDAARRAEIEEMKTQYKTDWETRKKTLTTYAEAPAKRKAYLTVPEKSTTPKNSTEPIKLTSANIRAAYEHLVAEVQNNKHTYTKADWQVIDDIWTELDAQKNTIQNQLSAKDKYEISKAKTKYQTMKTGSKTGNAAEKGGSEVKEDVETGAEKTGEEAQKGGSKIGNAAKKVGSETKELYKKAEDKIDGTKDRK